jgi:hypothetical protein
MTLNLLNEKSLTFNSPPHSLIKLKKHQEAMLYKMMSIEKNSSIGVMSDFPGSGKSYPILALILWEKIMEGKTQNLLVVPYNLFSQWENYIKTFSKKLTFYKFIEYSDISTLMFNPLILSQYDILITTSLYYSTITDYLNNNKLNRIIIDEIDSVNWFINNKNCRDNDANYFPSKHTWFISASYDHLLKLNKDLYNKINCNQNCICKCEESFIKNSFNIPTPINFIYKCFDQYINSGIFEEIGGSNLVQNINAMDYQYKLKNITNVANSTKELLNYIIKDNLITIDSLENDQKQYEIKLQNFNLNAGKRILIEDQLALTKSSLEKNKKIIENIFKRINETACPICLEDYSFDSKLIVDCCKNCFCLECLSYQLEINNKCPLCRCIINTQNIIKFELEPELEQEIELESEQEPECLEESVFENLQKIEMESKINMMEKIINELDSNFNYKLIIFSDHELIFKNIKQYLLNKNVKHSELDAGNIKGINKMINDYKYGDTKVLLINSVLYGSGLNFENTTDIILIHNSENKEQIIGRAQRPGRTSTLRIHNLLYDNEFSQSNLLPQTITITISNYNQNNYSLNNTFITKQDVSKIMTDLSLNMYYPNNIELFINCDSSSFNSFCEDLKDENIILFSEIKTNNNLNLFLQKYKLIEILLLKIKNELNTNTLSTIAVNLSNVYNQHFK